MFKLNIPLIKDIKGIIFDLDGVLVDTARFHYVAWKRLAQSLGFDFTEEDNERLKGVSRMKSLDILLEIGNISCSLEEKERLAEQKNRWYTELLQSLSEKDLLPGSLECLKILKESGYLIALGSASKNAKFIIDRLGIYSYFDVIVDGTLVEKAKPDPEVFIKAAEMLKLCSSQCIVFEDSKAGIEAAKSCGMIAIAVGKKENLPGADFYIYSLADLLELLDQNSLYKQN
ncbi:MAG: beta-phosphoglucomutase [Treponemataceae bacterium]|nr:beta-phosphoglucomutase [Treponemataceae bacterium]